jgi:hypothetical protein
LNDSGREADIHALNLTEKFVPIAVAAVAALFNPLNHKAVIQ